MPGTRPKSPDLGADEGSPAEQFACDQCDLSFPSEEALARHRELHEGWKAA